MYKSKDEQISTWMDWIWSSMCLELVCTSPLSSFFKWAGGGGINSPRHQTSRWLKAAESSTVGWSDAIFFSGVVSSGATSRCLHRIWLLWHNCYDAMHRRCFGSFGAEDPASKSPLLASTRPSDRPTLHLDQGIRSSGAEGFILAHLCMNSNWASDRPTVSPPDHRIIRCYCLHCSSSATRPTLLKDGPSVHPTVPRVSPVYQLVRRLHRRLLLRYRRFIRRCLFFSFLAWFWPLFFSFWHVVFLHHWDLEVSTKIC
jgi:hypothetical protein